MKDKAFIIKVGDLLQETGRSDEVVFENKWTDNLPGLTDEGITGTISMQSLSKDSVFVELENIKLEQEHSEEEIFPINSRDETINVEDMVIQAIRLGDPIAIHCPVCAQKVAELPETPVAIDAPIETANTNEQTNETHSPDGENKGGEN